LRKREGNGDLESSELHAYFGVVAFDLSELGIELCD
jgi:hypothetical protein